MEIVMLQSVLLRAQKKRLVGAHAFKQDTKLKNYFSGKRRNRNLGLTMNYELIEKRAHDVAISLGLCWCTWRFNLPVQLPSAQHHKFVLLALRNHCGPSVAERDL
jgi:hypothetical protein